MNPLTTNNLFFIPVCFKNATILLGHIVSIRPFRDDEVVIFLTDGSEIYVPTSMEYATKQLRESIINGKELLK